MQIVIDIPEYIYKICQGHGDPVYRYIAKGTPLPEGHGRLIDADALCKDFENHGMSWEAGMIKYAHTIVEADKS